MKLNIDEIKQILPHRYPFLLIDKITDGEEGKWAEAVKCVSGNEPFFQGHFPQMCVMPGVLILEALAQTGGVALLSVAEDKGKIALFGGVKNARFRRQVVPGDVLTLRCEMTRRMGDVGVATATAKVGDEVACTAELTFAIMGNSV
jgi:3-hydroxyacyl-[acyl-carrier-protein] dehydratase